MLFISNEFYHILFWISTSISALMIASLLYQKNNQTSNRLLVVIIAGSIYVQFIRILVITHQIQNYPWLFQSHFPLELEMGALLYLYTLSMTEPGFRLCRSHLIHLLPFLLGLCWYVYFILDPFTPVLIQTRAPLIELRQFKGILFTAIFSTYWILSVVQLHRYTKRIPLFFSNLEEMRLKWLRFLLQLGFLALVPRLIDLFTDDFSYGVILNIPTLTVIVNLVAFFALKYSPVFEFRNSNWMEHLTKKTPSLTDPSIPVEQICNRLKEHLVKTKIYIQSDLNLARLAQEMGVKSYQLSYAINRGLKMNFFDLINFYRIEEAKLRLTQTAYAHMNILGIASDCGFNSKSSFNEAFKKFTQMTPSEYRESNPTN